MDFGYSYLLNGITADDTTALLEDGNIDRMPESGFYACIYDNYYKSPEIAFDNDRAEIVRVITRAGSSITEMVRGVLGTTALNFNTNGKRYKIICSVNSVHLLPYMGGNTGKYLKITGSVGNEVAEWSEVALANYIPLTQKAAADGVATLGSDGKIPTTQLPALAINDIFTVVSQAAMLALTAQRGDVAIRTDINKNFILSTDSPSTLADWIELLTPADSVTSVAGRTGVVTLTKSDVALENVDNTSDMSKPVSTAMQTALDLKQDASTTPNYVDIPLSIVTSGNFGAQTTAYQPFGSGLSNSTDAGGAGANVNHAAGIEGTIVGMIIDARANTLTNITGAEFRLWINAATTTIVTPLALTTKHFEDIAHSVTVSKTDKVQIRYTCPSGAGTFTGVAITLILRKALVRV